MRFATHVLAAVIIAACSTQPRATAPQPERVPVRSPATAASTDVTTATSKASTDSGDADFDRAARSYRQVERNGRQLYCRYEAPLGTRIPIEQCLTQAQLMELVRKTRDTTDRMRLPKPAPCGSQVTGCE